MERQFEVIGEALNQLSRASPMVAALVPELPRLVAFRNILIHGYAVAHDQLVWEAATAKLPALRTALAQILDGMRRESEPTE